MVIVFLIISLSLITSSQAGDKEELLIKKDTVEARFTSVVGEINYLTGIGSMLQERITNKINERDKIKQEHDQLLRQLQALEAAEKKAVEKPTVPVPEPKKK